MGPLCFSFVFDFFVLTTWYQSRGFLPSSFPPIHKDSDITKLPIDPLGERKKRVFFSCTLHGMGMGVPVDSNSCRVQRRIPSSPHVCLCLCCTSILARYMVRERFGLYV